jgi:hypothetical protein
MPGHDHSGHLRRICPTHSVKTAWNAGFLFEKVERGCRHHFSTHSIETIRRVAATDSFTLSFPCGDLSSLLLEARFDEDQPALRISCCSRDPPDLSNQGPAHHTTTRLIRPRIKLHLLPYTASQPRSALRTQAIIVRYQAPSPRLESGRSFGRSLHLR